MRRTHLVIPAALLVGVVLHVRPVAAGPAAASTASRPSTAASAERAPVPAGGPSSRLTPRLADLLTPSATQAAQPPATPAPAPGTPPATPAPATPAQPKYTGPLPPANSPPLVRTIELRFPTQGNVSVIEPQTYLYYIRTRPSRPSEGVWVPYNEQEVLQDFQRLWNTHFLDNLWIDVEDEPYPNGVVGKHIIYNLEERERVKIVDYEGTGAKVLDRSKIDDALKNAGVTMQLDTFLDQGTIQKVEGILRDMLHEKGFQAATVTHKITPMEGGPKLVHLTFEMDEGPKVKIKDVEFVGNHAVSSGTLRRQLKYNKSVWFLSFISGRGTYQESKFADDAERIVEYYQDKGYIEARVGDPQLKVLGDSSDGKTRWVQLRIPVTEGRRYKIGTFTFAGNTVVKSDILRPMFKLKTGDYYDAKKIKKGLEDAQELYGRGGYFEFTGYPDLHPLDGTEPPNAAQSGAPEPKAKPTGPPIVDVTMRLQEGKQYFVNRITFVGNTTTHDTVIRRQLRLFEGGVFNTEALKYSIRRLNQLGYFKKLEGSQDVSVTKTPDATNKVDVKLKLQEQNRNQLTFGAGVSQFEGFFGQLGFTTSNFMGRGESLSLQVQAGSLAQNYSAAFTEPFLFDRNMSGSIQVFRQDIEYLSQFTQRSTGGNIGFGFPLADFTRMFLNYSYQAVKVYNVNPVFLTPAALAGNPYLQDTLLIAQGGARTVSKFTPSIVHDTVDSPLFPTTGRRYTLSVDLAGLGGDTNFIKPLVEGVWYLKQSNRTSFGFRAQASYIRPFSGSDANLPIFEKLFTGGEYSVRGFDIRSIGPRDPSGLVVGGNKLLLFNAEYLISIAGPVRLVMFYDAGQVDAVGQNFALNQFKTSTGLEIRFLMPVMNIPFRLIFAYNPQRSGVLNNSLLPQSAFSFRFAVGSTF
ncbi:MAG: BamA/TamA family outer membrane protein [Acidobacteriota bacterium]|nr:BamA/TamA family outer membrane protein [Acidobacteriota bacterium]